MEVSPQNPDLVALALDSQLVEVFDRRQWNKAMEFGPQLHNGNVVKNILI